MREHTELKKKVGLLQSEKSERTQKSSKGKNKLEFLTKLGRRTGMLLAETALKKVSFLFFTFLTVALFV